MKKLLILFMLTVAQISFAQIDRKGNGGNVVVCKDAKNKITSVETLDLFEGRAIYNLNYKEDSTPALRQALRYSDPISKYLGSPVSAVNLSQDVKDLYQNLYFLPKGVGLKPINDIGNFIIPKDCEIVQTINYRGWKSIYVDSDIWNLLSETQKAALVLHEAIYSFYREAFYSVAREETSTRARLAVAALISGAQVESVDKPVNLKGNKYLHCRTLSPMTEFFYYQNQDNQSVVQFRYFAEYAVLTRTWIASEYDSKVITGNLNSPFEDNVRLQVGFSTPTSGKVYYLSLPNLSAAEFKCKTWQAK